MRRRFGVGPVEFFLHATGLATCHLWLPGWIFVTWSFLDVFSASHLVLVVLHTAASWGISFPQLFLKSWRGEGVICLWHPRYDKRRLGDAEELSSEEHSVTCGRGFLLAAFHHWLHPYDKAWSWGREGKWESENVGVPRSLKSPLFHILMHESPFTSIKARCVINQGSLSRSAAFSGDAARQSYVIVSSILNFQ